MVIAYTYAEFPLLRDCMFMQMRRDKNNLRIIARRDTRISIFRGYDIFKRIKSIFHESRGESRERS